MTSTLQLDLPTLEDMRWPPYELYVANEVHRFGEWFAHPLMRIAWGGRVELEPNAFRRTSARLVVGSTPVEISMPADLVMDGVDRGLIDPPDEYPDRDLLRSLVEKLPPIAVLPGKLPGVRFPLKPTADGRVYFLLHTRYGWPWWDARSVATLERLVQRIAKGDRRLQG